MARQELMETGQKGEWIVHIRTFVQVKQGSGAGHTIETVSDTGYTCRCVGGMTAILIPPPASGRVVRSFRRGVPVSEAELDGDELDGDHTRAVGLIQHSQLAVQRAVTPNESRLSLVWAGALFVGYGALWLGSRAGGVSVAAWAIFVGAVVLGWLATAGEFLRSTRYIRGGSQRRALLYILTWVAVMAVEAVLLGVLYSSAPADVWPPLLTVVLPSVLPCVAAGLIFMATASMQERLPSFLIGAALALLGCCALLAGFPVGSAVMAIGGMTVFLVAGIVLRLHPATRGG